MKMRKKPKRNLTINGSISHVKQVNIAADKIPIIRKLIHNNLFLFITIKKKKHAPISVQIKYITRGKLFDTCLTRLRCHLVANITNEFFELEYTVSVVV